MVVLPVAETAVSMVLMVAPTDGMSRYTSAPCSPSVEHEQRAALDLHVRAQRGHALDGLVDRARADVAAARHGHLRPGEEAQQHRGQIVGGAHLARQLVRGRKVINRLRVDDHRGPRELHARAQRAQHLNQRPDVVDIGEIFNRAGGMRQQRGRDDCHRGVFTAGDRHLAAQAHAALNAQDIRHALYPSAPRRARQFCLLFIISEHNATIKLNSRRGSRDKIRFIAFCCGSGGAIQSFLVGNAVSGPPRRRFLIILGGKTWSADNPAAHFIHFRRLVAGNGFLYQFANW